jgi:hypothetical protein
MAAGVGQTCRLNWLVGPVLNPSVHWQCCDSSGCHKDRSESATPLNFQPHCDMSRSPLIWFEAKHSPSTYINYLENSSLVERGLNLRDTCEGNSLSMLVEPAGAAILLNRSCQGSNSMAGKENCQLILRRAAHGITGSAHFDLRHLELLMHARWMTFLVSWVRG